MYKIIYTINGKSKILSNLDWQILMVKVKELKMINKNLQWVLYNQGGVLLDSNVLSPKL